MQFLDIQGFRSLLLLHKNLHRHEHSNILSLYSSMLRELSCYYARQHKTHTSSPFTAFPTIQSHQPTKQNGRDTSRLFSATAHPHATAFQDHRRSNHNPARRYTATIPVPQCYVRKSRTRVPIPSNVDMRSRDEESRHRVREKSPRSRMWRKSNWAMGRYWRKNQASRAVEGIRENVVPAAKSSYTIQGCCNPLSRGDCLVEGTFG